MSAEAGVVPKVRPNADARPCVEATGITQVFGDGEARTSVLENVDIRLEFGDMVAIVGPSGSGKSTLLNILGLLAPPTEGTYVLDGVEVTGTGPRDRAGTRLEKIALVFQSFHLIDHKSALANVELPLKYMGVGKGQRRAAAQRMLAELGMAHRRDARPAVLSGGEKQRVAIARALVTRPKLLLCDEPTGSLDSRRSAEVLKILREQTGSHQTTVIVTHDPWVASQCDRVLSLEDGRLVETTSPTREPNQAVAIGSTPAPDQDSMRVLEMVPVQRRGAAPEEAAIPAKSRWLLTSLKEAAEAVSLRFRRNMLTTLGVMLGVATLVLTSGITSTIAGQISDAFDVFKAQHVVLTQTSKTPLSREQAVELAAGPEYASLSRLNGVNVTAVVRPATEGMETITTVPKQDNQFDGRVQTEVFSATPTVFEAQGQKIEEGRGFDEGHVARRDRVAVVGRSLLNSLGTPWTPGLTLYVGATPLTVIGVASENPSLSEDHGAVYTPLGIALEGHEGGATKIIVATSPGAASQVGREAPTALSPRKPGLFSASVPPEPETLRQAVDQQQRSLLMILSGVTLLIGTIGIMNTFLVAVLERRREIGLRLAVGARPLGIAAQFSAEAVLTSAVGTILGTALALDAVASISLVNHWRPILRMDTVLGGVVAGLAVGLLAGAYPAWKAGKTDPVETLMHA
ncbi:MULTISPECIES: ABC transporter ATP-binding protein/permease [Micrococcaceae]|uniref:ABC transporter ATP-binding protein/permease n=1 Tax=unclassified Kocuria TaxID=2649579 RepID=UPI001012585C|nr:MULTISPECIES: ABC transporter ATP-binding protein/permease [unclassified Kocuria]